MEKSGCVFCDALSEGLRVIINTRHFFVMLDLFPVNLGHALIIPKRHQPDIFSLSVDEWGALDNVLRLTKSFLVKEFVPDGYNIGLNCGAAAGQTVGHLHIHVIPRYRGDVIDPRGGVRNLKPPLKEYPAD